MDAETATFGLVAALAAGVLGGLKYLAPKLKAYVPNALWPVAVAALTAGGLQVCTAAGVVCDGNPLDWDPTTVTAIVGGFLAILVQQATKGLRWAFRWTQDEETGPFFQ